MKHTIMCLCGKLAIRCDEASKGLQNIVDNGKKEFIDEIENVFNTGYSDICIIREDWQRLKDRHLTPIPENKHKED